MSTSTGAPLNLNKFETSDDIVTALTTLFNQNMDKLNQSNTGVKTWAPSTVYNKGDIVLHKWDANKVLFATVAHTSSTASTESAWNDGDGSKWLSMSSNVYITDPAASEFLPQGTVTTNGGQIKRARVNTYPGKPSYAQDMDLLTSRVVRWTPNTHYNVGDMFIVTSPVITTLQPTGTTAKLEDAIFIVKTAFTSGSNFPASDDAISSNYRITNPEGAYQAWKNDIFMGNWNWRFYRQGNRVSVTVSDQLKNGPMVDNGWRWIPNDSNAKVPTWARPAGSEYPKLTVTVGQGNYALYELGPSSSQFVTPRGNQGNGTFGYGSTSYAADPASMQWPAFTPVN